MRAVLYVLALLMTVLVRTIKGQLDLYHAIFVMHMLVFFSVIQLDGMSCVPMGIDRYSSETKKYRHQHIYLETWLQTGYDLRRSVFRDPSHFLFLGALRVDQRLCIWVATAVQRPREICFFLYQRPRDRSLVTHLGYNLLLRENPQFRHEAFVSLFPKKREEARR